MFELNNRINAQREILTIVNSKTWKDEPLFSLSYGAINRWINKNQISSTSNLALHLFEAGRKLCFLANKSQEQITEEYKALSKEVSEITQAIKKILLHT